MNVFFKTTALITLSSFTLCSCVTNRNGQTTWSSPQACIAAHTAGGAIVGAGTGALVAALTGNKKKMATGAVVGGVAGGALAFAYAWGHCFAAFTKVRSESTKPYNQVQNEIGYNSQQGSVAKIQEYSLDPVAIAPGEQPTLSASYYVMTPEDQDISVTETVALKIFDSDKKKFVVVGKSSETIVVKPGLRKAVSEIPIPSNAEEGKFFFIFKIEMQGKVDQRELPLTITNNQEILSKARSDSSSRQAQVAAVEAPPVNQVVADSGSKDVSPANSKQIEITANKANLRENPDPHSKIVTKANKGDVFTILNTVSINGKNWCQIKLDSGANAWVISSLYKVLE
jgi:hypothetical protein